VDAIMKVTFPTFARLQDHKDMLKKSLERSLYFIALFVFPMTAGIALIAPDIINFVPKYTKWAPAIFPLYLYAINIIIASITTPLTNAFNAVGKITLTTKFMIMWTVLTWIFFPIFSLKFGYIGTSIATLIVGSSSFIVWYLADKIFHTHILVTILRPLISTFIIIFVLYLLSLLHLTPLLNIILKSFIGVFIFALFHFLFSRKEIIWFLNQLKCQKLIA
jgi:O-antigen/teichoic acid export membrane protein